LAVVYVRQSSPQQVIENHESRERQYALADHAAALGWARDRIMVIDEDQGQSGRSAEHRPGFQRLLAEVAMGHVGLVLGLEMSRLSRSSRDWHHLLEVCALFGTLLADHDGVYDANDSNDRLLLGLKGTIGEYELVTMRNRLERGRLHKAERGALFTSVPSGYIRSPSGEVELDPDEQVRSVVRLIFDKFDELGSHWGVFRYLLNNGIRLGIRAHRGPGRGRLEWRRPAHTTVGQILHHPIYAGAYAYGRCPVVPERDASGRGRAGERREPMAEWKVLLRDRLPAYITWDRYLSNQRRLQQNRQTPGSPGTARDGAALLTGLLVCGTCGQRLRASYRARRKARYACTRHLYEGIEPACRGLNAAGVDDLVARQVLRALEPASLELSLRAIEDVRRERERLRLHWGQRLERARYEAHRAERQYQAVEPEDRLVARTLERRWEEALRECGRLEEEYDRFLREQPPQLSEGERGRILALSSDIPALWDAPGTTPAHRKEVIRLLVERVVAHVQDDSEHVEIELHWRGGFTSRHALVRPVRQYAQLRDYNLLIDKICAWHREGRTSAQIAAGLNREGFRTPMGRGDYTPELVRKLRSSRVPVAQGAGAGLLGPDERWLPDLARELRVRAAKLRAWAERGWVNGRKIPLLGKWVVWSDDRERARLRTLGACSNRGVVKHPVALITPGPRDAR
jgi:DNA invertase Pin-like site-specific DNA recombinase